MGELCVVFYLNCSTVIKQFNILHFWKCCIALFALDPEIFRGMLEMRSENFPITKWYWCDIQQIQKCSWFSCVPCLMLHSNICFPTESTLATSNGTLVICPASLIHHWKMEIERHVCAKKLSIYMYHGSNREKSTKVWVHEVLFLLFWNAFIQIVLLLHLFPNWM